MRRIVLAFHFARHRVSGSLYRATGYLKVYSLLREGYSVVLFWFWNTYAFSALPYIFQVASTPAQALP